MSNHTNFPLVLRSVFSGYYIEWHGGTTFHVFDRHGNELDVFSLFDENGNAPGEMRAREAMMDRMRNLPA